MAKRQNHPINKNYPIHKNVVKRFTEKTAIKLYQKLIDKKAEIQNRPKNTLSLLSGEKGGDQADQVNRLQEEAKCIEQNKRNNILLEKVLIALARMESSGPGDYGVCEQTEEIIELNRLLSLPWTTLSIEGAEIEESERNLKQVR